MAALAVLAVGFGLRASFIPAVRQNFDHGFPHGLGLSILDAVARGDWRALPLVSLDSTIGLGNPAGASYFWALVGIFDRSALAATAVSGMLSVLGLAMLFDLARRFFSPWPAVAATALAAVSAWAVSYADGAWVQGQLEFCAVCSAWVLWIGLRDGNPRRVFAGLLITALFTQTYVVAYVLVLQAALACALCLRRGLIAPITAGLAACALVFGVHMIASQGSLQGALDFWGRFQNTGRPDARPAAGIDLTGLDHARRLVTARDAFGIGDAGANPDTSPGLPLRRDLGNARATLLDLLLLAGSGLAVWRIRDPRLRMMLAWFGLPVAATVVVASLRDAQLIHPFYLLTTAPAGALLAAAPLSLLRGRRATLAVVGLLLAAASMPAIDIVLRANFVQGVRYVSASEGMYGLNIAELAALQRDWRGLGCDGVAINEDDPFNLHKLHDPNWARSLVAPLPYTGDALWRITPGGLAFSAPPGDAVCVAGFEPVAWSEGRAIQSALGGASVHTQRLAADGAPERLQTPLDTNIGWQLIALDAPVAARSGETLTIRHVWRVARLPDEPFGQWYYAPFAKLVDAQGGVRVMQDRAPSVIGYAWRPGNLIVGGVTLAIPPDLAAGDYTLELSLFDPNQGKNAVYIDPGKPAAPMIAIRRDLRVSRGP